MIQIKNNQKILFIGDSITDVKWNRRFAHKIGGCNVYCLQVAKNLKKKYKGLKFFYKGIASNRTYHVYDRLTKDCINLKPDVIVMLIGVNDAWENYVPEQYPPLLRPMEPHLKEIYRRIKTELPEAKLLTLLPFLTSTIEEKQPFHKVLDGEAPRDARWAHSSFPRPPVDPVTATVLPCKSAVFFSSHVCMFIKFILITIFSIHFITLTRGIKHIPIHLTHYR